MSVSLVALMVKNPPAMQETQVWALGRKDPLEKELATHSSILAWRIHGQRSLVGCSPWGRKGVGHNWATDALLLLVTNSSLGDSIWDSSERLLQKDSGGRSLYMILAKGEFSAIEHSFYKRFFANHKGLILP